MDSFFVFSMDFNRLFIEQLASSYFQTFMLWLLAYLTLFIPIHNLSDRFMGSVTALLVLASLLGSMDGSLPKSAEMNLIDFWFLWYITNIFSIIVFHVVMEKKKAYSTKKKEAMNKTVSFILPCLVLSFNIVYFSLSIIQPF